MSSFGFTTPMAIPPRGDARLRPVSPTKTVPFDYVFQFALQGTRGNKVQDVVEISSEGVFVALSVGYSLMLDEGSSARTFQPVVDQGIALHNPVFVPFFKLDDSPPTDAFDGLLLVGIPGTEMAVLNLRARLPLSNVTQPIRIGLDGTATVPFTVTPRSILRVWDRTHNLLSELFEVNSPNASPTPVIGPNPTTKKVPAAGDTIVHVYGSPGERVEVFLLEHSTGTFLEVIDPASPSSPWTLPLMPTFDLRTGRADVPLRVAPNGGDPIDKSLSPGEVLLVRSAESTATGISLSMFIVPRPRVVSELTLAELEAGLAAESGADLTRGFRLNPNAADLFAADLSLNQVFDGTRGPIFEIGTSHVAAEEVSFLYSFDVGDTGREHQNRPIHNIAGLGIANGDRPSRPLAKPMVFEPRSFIRLQIEEISGPKGTLFIVLQGYKILGTGRLPG
jgi:hypothetical protein